MKESYEDFIGEELSVEISPYDYKSGYEALECELWKRIKKELNHNNGLLCRFENIKTTIDKKIIVTGVVTKCEVDC